MTAHPTLPAAVRTATLAALALAAAAACAQAPAGSGLVVPAAFKNAGPGAPLGREVPEAAVGPSAWWTLFGDPELDRLEVQALAENQDLRASLDRVAEARAQAGAVRSVLYPSLTAPIAGDRQRTTNTAAPATSRLIGNSFFATQGSTVPATFEGQVLSNTFSDYQVPLVVSYEVDLFGRLRHRLGQARANADASLADRLGVRLALTAQVAANYFTLRAADSEVAVLDRSVRLRRDAEELQQQRLKAGSASDVDFLKSRVERANTEADLVDAVQRRAEIEDALAALCGQPASGFHLDPRPLEAAPPPAVPQTIPAQLLSQRPDLIEAERRIAAADEGVKAARAEAYPVLRVGAGYGFESSQANQLLENQSHTWSISGGISIPIFDGGRDAALLKVARAQNDQAYDAYRQTALGAFREVENALSGLRQRAVQADARRRAAEDARKVFEAAQHSYGEGGLTYFEVIDAERVLLGAELAQVRTLASRYAATVDLIRALGGGFGAPESPAQP